MKVRHRVKRMVSYLECEGSMWNEHRNVCVGTAAAWEGAKCSSEGKTPGTTDAHADAAADAGAAGDEAAGAGGAAC